MKRQSTANSTSIVPSARKARVAGTLETLLTSPPITVLVSSKIRRRIPTPQPRPLPLLQLCLPCPKNSFVWRLCQTGTTLIPDCLAGRSSPLSLTEGGSSCGHSTVNSSCCHLLFLSMPVQLRAGLVCVSTGCSGVSSPGCILGGLTSVLQTTSLIGIVKSFNSR